MIKRSSVLLSFAALGLFSPCSAASVESRTQASAFVTGGAKAEQTYDGKQGIYVKGTPPLDYVRKAYFKFDIYELKKHVPQRVTFSATLFEKPSEKIRAKFYYLFKAADGSEASPDQWEETGISWSNAPGNYNNPTSVDLTQAVFLGSVELEPNASQLRFSSEQLAEAIKADLDNTATIIITAEGPASFAMRPRSWSDSAVLKAK